MRPSRASRIAAAESRSRAAFSSGSPLEEILADPAIQELGPIAAIHIVHVVAGLPLDRAKVLVFNSAAFAGARPQWIVSQNAAITAASLGDEGGGERKP